jgi:peptide chain release factor 2
MGMEETKERIREIEAAMAQPDFWNDKQIAQELIKELQNLKEAQEGGGKYDKNDAIVTFLAGAGGDDAEDFAYMLFQMYSAYADSKGWTLNVLHKNENEHGGYRNLTVEIGGKRVYGTLKHESGVHRLVRVSPFNAKSLRHTSFALVEVLPKLEQQDKEFDIPETDLRFEYSKSSGPGGQNVNKRETAVRVVHIPTNIAVHVDSERSQAQNKERAIKILEGKLYKLREEAIKQNKDAMSFTKTQEVAWGNQIRSYVLHPYKMVKDHRTDVETSDVKSVLEDGDIEMFLEAEKDLDNKTNN